MKKIRDGHKYFLITASIMLAGISILIYLLWLSPIESVHAAAPSYVRPDGDDLRCNGQSDQPYTGDGNCAFATITHGISQADLGGYVYVAGGTYNESLILNRAITVAMTSNLTLNGDINLQQGALVAPRGKLTLTGNYARSRDGVFRSNRGTLVMNGTSQQSIGGSEVTSFFHLLIDNPQHVRIEYYESVDMTVTLQSGSILLDRYVLELSPQGRIVGVFSASNLVAISNGGMICKTYWSNGSIPLEGLSIFFPVGDRTGTPEYSPAQITIHSATLLAYPRVCLSVVNKRKEENFFPHYLRRYWVTSSQFMDNISATTVFTYTQSDVVGTESLLRGIQYVNQAWDVGSYVNDVNHSFTIDTSSFTDFSAGGSAATITINTFKATPLKNAIRLDWNTTYEENVLGFNIYRSTTSTPDEMLNGAMIPSVSNGTISPGGFYTFTDSTASAGVLYTYWLEVVTDHSTELFTPIQAIWYNYLFLPTINRTP